MITQRFGLMKYIPVFHPFGVALRSKSVPDVFVTKDITMEWNNSVYFRLSKILCGFKDQARTRLSGEKCGLSPIETISLDKWQNDTEAKEAMFFTQIRLTRPGP
jgi:hypothetical protein